MEDEGNGYKNLNVIVTETDMDDEDNSCKELKTQSDPELGEGLESLGKHKNHFSDSENSHANKGGPRVRSSTWVRSRPAKLNL